MAAKERIPQAGAWDDLKTGTNIVFKRFVNVPANAFTDHMVSIEQMIPVSGKNRSKERVAAAAALAIFEEARRQELSIPWFNWKKYGADIARVRTAHVERAKR